MKTLVSRLGLLNTPTASLKRGNTAPPHTHTRTNECLRYDTKPSDGKGQDLELSGIWNTLSFPLLLALL